mmetsp:Transcript_7341/g.10850  ORF Transcript_7341/g.10850 Transcript_7341/m.10850 type:complete len:147 (+) Transcript_7341:13-453(+)
MDEFLESHIKREKESYAGEADTYGKHLETTLKRRLYLGQIEESQLLFMPKRSQRDWKTTLQDLVPGIASLWLFGISVTYTYPRAIKTFRYLFPSVRSFVLIHLGIAPMMMFVNLNLLGVFKGLSFYYYDKITGGTQTSLLNELFEE